MQFIYHQYDDEIWDSKHNYPIMNINLNVSQRCPVEKELNKPHISNWLVLEYVICRYHFSRKGNEDLLRTWTHHPWASEASSWVENEWGLLDGGCCSALSTCEGGGEGDALLCAIHAWMRAFNSGCAITCASVSGCRLNGSVWSLHRQIGWSGVRRYANE